MKQVTTTTATATTNHNNHNNNHNNNNNNTRTVVVAKGTMKMMMMTLREVKKCLEKWGIKSTDENFFNDCNCVSFIPINQSKGLKVYVFRNELWVFLNHENRRENFVRTYSFNDEEKLRTTLNKKLGLAIPQKRGGDGPNEASRRCFGCCFFCM